VPELAEVFRAGGPAYREKYASKMPPSHRTAMRDIEDCRSEAMGGQLFACDRCPELRYVYHSCRNRHCPKCHGDETRDWLEHQRSRLLAGSYFLLTFTLPAELRELARSHQRKLYSILMRSAAQALMKLAADPRFLGATPGILAVLHTWTRAMLYHPHVHFLVTAGGLAPDGQRWLEPRNPHFLVPCQALSLIFRAKVRDALVAAGFIKLVPAAVWKKAWVVHCQHAGSGDKVLDYLARYVVRIAITDRRIESFDGSHVTFTYQDSKTRQTKRCTLPVEQFIQRFLQHVLPRGFTKVRYYGLFSSACKDKLEKARAMLPRPSPAPELNPEIPPAGQADAHDDKPQFDLCPACRGGRMIPVAVLPRKWRPP
jgi:Putative transposase/Transposase zinc-binding domain